MKRIVFSSKKTRFGNTVSHAMNHSRRKWKVNFQTARFKINDELVKVTASAKELKTYNKKPDKLKNLINKFYF